VIPKLHSWPTPLQALALVTTKRKEVKEDFNLVANGKVSIFGGPWKVKEKILFTSFHFPHQQILLKLFFPLIFKFYFIMVLHRYFTSFPIFP
jgi:hypothetical protein